MKIGMFWLGLFLVGVGAGTSDGNTNEYSFTIGATLATIGMALMFFSFKEMRDPYRLKRMVRSIQGYL